MLTRSVAKPGDKVAVTGYLGASAAGLEVLSKNLTIEAEAATSLKEAFLRPWPRVSEGQILVQHGVRAAIDISDGLVSDLSHVCQASRVGAWIEVDRLPIQPAVRANFGDMAIEMALSGGEGNAALMHFSVQLFGKARDQIFQMSQLGNSLQFFLREIAIQGYIFPQFSGKKKNILHYQSHLRSEPGQIKLLDVSAIK